MCVLQLLQHDGGLGLIEANEIYNNTLAGVWVTTGEYCIIYCLPCDQLYSIT